MSVSPFDHPLLSAILGDEETAQLFSVESELAAMIAFERALAEAEASEGIIDQAAADAIVPALAKFSPDMPRLRAGVARDGLVVPELVRQLREAVGEPHGAKLHFGSTSQDVIDTALVLRLKPIVERFDRQLVELIGRFVAMSARFGSRNLTGVTRMQAAIPIRVSDRIASWRQPLERHRQRLSEQSPRLLIVQFGGAAGTLEKFSDKGPALRKAVAIRLGLGDAPQWQSQRDNLAEFASWLSLVTGTLGKLGQDLALMALNGKEIALAGGGGSSAMPHKRNPVITEVLVALARFNATQLSGMHEALVHEQERSGANWTFEWMLLPQMVVSTAAALRLAIELTSRVESLGS